MIPAPARQETHPGAGVCQGKKPHQGFFSNPAPHQGITWSKSTTALGMRGARALEGVRKSYRARYYDPAVGRFISEDSWQFLTGPNFYSYVANDPTGQIDPTGHQQQVPYHGGPPVYEPGVWNDPGHVHTNNCYSYACDRLHPPGPPYLPQPGDESGHGIGPIINCVTIKIAARADGLKNGKNGECPCGTHDVTDYHKVRLYFTFNFMGSGWPDYHWYRQDWNGKWSSKHGSTPVGPQITNPDQDAHSWGYEFFCGTMCAPNK
jgi:RHS repeat-associated protein